MVEESHQRVVKSNRHHINAFAAAALALAPLFAPGGCAGAKAGDVYSAP